MAAMPMTFAQVDAYATSLPGVAIGARWGNKTWMINENGFAWERPLSKADLKRLVDAGGTLPAGEILAVNVDGLDAKDAILSMDLPGYFTIEHFVNFPAILIELRKARVKDVKASVRDAFELAAAKKPSKPKAKAKAKNKPSARAR